MKYYLTIHTYSLDINENPMPTTETVEVLIHQVMKGDTGSSGVQISSEQPTDPAINVWIKPDEAAGYIHETDLDSQLQSKIDSAVTTTAYDTSNINIYPSAVSASKTMDFSAKHTMIRYYMMAGSRGINFNIPADKVEGYMHRILIDNTDNNRDVTINLPSNILWASLSTASGDFVVSAGRALLISYYYNGYNVIIENTQSLRVKS